MPIIDSLIGPLALIIDKIIVFIDKVMEFIRFF